MIFKNRSRFQIRNLIIFFDVIACFAFPKYVLEAVSSNYCSKNKLCAHREKSLYKTKLQRELLFERSEIHIGMNKYCRPPQAPKFCYSNSFISWRIIAEHLRFFKNSSEPLKTSNPKLLISRGFPDAPLAQKGAYFGECP